MGARTRPHYGFKDEYPVILKLRNLKLEALHQTVVHVRQRLAALGWRAGAQR